MESLEMHSAVRNVMRLFDRIKDFEKRVLAREQRPRPRQPGGATAMRSRCSRKCSGRSLPHIAEELWLSLGNERARRTNAVARRIFER